MWILGLKGLILFDNTPCALMALLVLSGRCVVDKGILYGHARRMASKQTAQEFLDCCQCNNVLLEKFFVDFDLNQTGKFVAKPSVFLQV